MHWLVKSGTMDIDELGVSPFRKTDIKFWRNEARKA